ncbi:hypothetical protein VRRI112168_02500 [Vreelandella rituensis]|uniref:Uncharacterized protein n=2 Tax=Vreelandella rituensis TaxID=2282306 RepID=A0A368U9K6_9GAMM|nr:hypothetical protein DU506_00220 [Halomonas rituensis]
MLDMAVTRAAGGISLCSRAEDGSPRYEAYSAEQPGVDPTTRYRARLGWIGSIPPECQELGDTDLWRPSRDFAQGESLMVGRRLHLEGKETDNEP